LAAGGFNSGKRGVGSSSKSPVRRGGRAASKPAGLHSPVARQQAESFSAPAEFRTGWREAVERTVQGVHYELVDIERAAHGLLRVYIDRIPGWPYALPGEFVTVEDCELVTRQLQYALEVAGADYARLEVSSPGLDRPLRTEADYARFAGQQVSITLKLPFEGRKIFKGLLGRGEQGGWMLQFSTGKTEQVLGFGLDEVREARLVPVLDFKGRRGAKPADEPAAGGPAVAGPGMNGG
jgi:ribosome maturation factor RimP